MSVNQAVEDRSSAAIVDLRSSFFDPQVIAAFA
jgi:hypothetical protein